MERSRSERHGRTRRNSKRPPLRAVLAVAAAAAVCAGGVWIYAQRGSEETAAVSGSYASPGTTPGASASTAAKTAPASPAASSTPAASSAPSVKPSPSAAAGLPVTPKPESVPASAGGSVKLAFVGDVLFASTVETTLKQMGYDYPYRELKQELQQPDWTVANLETPISVRGEEQKKEYTYRSRPEALKPFKEAGFDLVNLANNHIMDYGVDGLLDTLKALDQEGIHRTGAGKNVAEAYQPVILEKNGIKTAFLGFSHKVPDNSWKAGATKPGTTQLYDTKPALEAIAKAKKEADLVVVMTHWGEERKDRPLETHRTMAHKFIDAGADLIIGSHPHVLQGFEQYKGRWIAYSLGNFLFTTNTVPATWETVVLNAECSKTGDCRMSAVPVWNKFARPIRMEAADGDKLFDRLSSISYGAKVDREGRIEAAASGAAR
ncbi:CapA family protein [Gorillibacterium sp. sgz5001074]|uniref:CapA family protein n=1 Tax=Gorillibacterium sp. sgz5001074 TaxID=3446695 RepID=UPI003F66D114